MNAYKVIFTVLLILGMLVSTSAQWSIGPVLSSPSLSGIGFGVQATIDIGDSGKFSLSPSLLYRGSRETIFQGGRSTATIFDLNADIHLAYYQGSTIELYALAGFQFFNIRSKRFLDRNQDVHDFQVELGLNMGGGGELIVSKNIGLFIEAKYTVDASMQSAYSGGMYFRFGGR